MNDLAAIAGEINQEYEACEAAFSESLNHARRAGELLIEAKYWREGKLVRAIEEGWQPENKDDPARRYNQGQFADFWDA